MENNGRRVRYDEICREIEKLNVLAKSKEVSDTVKGSDGEFPFLTHTMSVSGLCRTKENEKLLTRLSELEREKEGIENFVSGIDDSLTRRIFELRLLKGYSWAKVAYLTNNTPDAVRMRCKRYLKQKKGK